MTDKRLERKMKDQENKDEDESQDDIQMRYANIRSKFVVSTPYEKGTNEYANCKGNLDDFSAINYNELIIEECLTCENCGAIDSTVRHSKLPDGRKLALCNWCIREDEFEGSLRIPKPEEKF